MTLFCEYAEPLVNVVFGVALWLLEYIYLYSSNSNISSEIDIDILNWFLSQQILNI